MKTALLALTCLLLAHSGRAAARRARPNVASWYGEEQRGRLMANGQRFDPDRHTAASWFYPLGTQVRVTINSPVYQNSPPPSVLVTITDRGPARRLVRNGRKIDLAHAAFKELADPDLGLVEVTISPISNGTNMTTRVPTS